MNPESKPIVEINCFWIGVCGHRLQGGQTGLDGKLLGIGVAALPESMVGARHRDLHSRAYEPCLRPILLERDVELDRPRRERFDLGLLRRIKSVGRADERPQDEGQQQGHIGYTISQACPQARRIL